MNRNEAMLLLRDHLEQYQKRSHADLAAMLGNQGCNEVRGPSGVEYQIEVDIVWDDEPGRTLRVLGAIDDGGWSAFSPLCDDFLLEADGTLR